MLEYGERRRLLRRSPRTPAGASFRARTAVSRLRPEHPHDHEPMARTPGARVLLNLTELILRKWKGVAGACAPVRPAADAPAG